MKHDESRMPVKPWLPRRSRTRENGRRRFVTTLSVLALSLSGCATPPTPTLPVQCPKNPPPPALSEPLPSQSYLLKWSELVREWRKRLTGTQTTQEH